MTSILVADDKKSMREFLTEALRKQGYQVFTAGDGEEALEVFRVNLPDLVITDVRMPKLDGIKLLQLIKEIDNEVVVIVITAFGTIETAVEAMKKGAYDYITKPFSLDELMLVLKKGEERRKLVNENRYLKRELEKRYQFDNIVAKSEKMKKVVEIMKSVIPTKSTVMLYGESGTGKEVIARAIHYNGPRKNQPFIKVSCAGLPESLLESELFGHERGAFTGAIRRRLGRFEIADRGTIFLDEIGELNTQIQVKLLRVIQHREFERVGGSHSIKVDVRIIAATNRDLKKAIEKGEFREDLYYRLNVVPINIPPLRERTEDIPLLAQQFLTEMNREAGKNIKYLSPGAMKCLLNYTWKGNVRELENIIERAVVVCGSDTVEEKDLPEYIRLSKSRIQPDIPELGAATLEETVESVERAMIDKALTMTKGNQTKAAKLLGINRGSLIYKMKKYDLR